MSGFDQSRDEPSQGPHERRSRRVHVHSYGCQMNAYDSQRMADLLAPEGYSECPDAQDADLVILNTCHIREHAAEKVFSELGRLRALKERRVAAGGEMKIVVAGCVAQAEGEEIFRRQKLVDVIVGPQAYHRLPELLRRAEIARPSADTEFPEEDKFDRLVAPSPASIRARGVSAFVTVQEGCDKFCSFCVVPYTRGAEMSRPVAAIVAEVDRLARAGVREVTLLGQNVNAYHGTQDDGAIASLATLCARLAKVEGVARIRYTTSHPNDMTADLVAAHRDLPELMPYLHLPVQAGSDAVLAAMHRKHRRADYLDLVADIRRARPDIALSSDFIVGFPGETDEDFAATLDLVETVGFASSYSFKYSPRPGTPGAELPDQISEAVKAARLARLQACLETRRQAFNAAMVGRVVEVLFEKKGRHDGQIAGKSPYLQAVQVDAASDRIGAILPVEIIAAGPNSLFGRLAPGRAGRETHR